MYRTVPFIRLGDKLGEILTENDSAFRSVVKRATTENGWFTAENIRSALDTVRCRMLDASRLETWLSKYPTGPVTVPRNIGVIMAGNIPLVGFFDLLCVLVSGHRCLVKPSSKDRMLTEYVTELLREAWPELPVFPLEDDSPLDAVIATGSDNANRYFVSRYGKIPHLLRRNRTSVAVLSGAETAEELDALARDVFSYFGMGCRNVSRVFVPEGYDVERLFGALCGAKVSHPGYRNAYRHHRALLRMRGTEFQDGGFFTLRESTGFSEALPDIVYTRYRERDEVEAWLRFNDEGIQCVVSSRVSHPRGVLFGRTQQPELWDYPDGVDTMAFLLGME